MSPTLNASIVLPTDAAGATLVGRVWVPGNPAGPSVVLVRDGEVIGIPPTVLTVSVLLENNHLVQAVRNAKGTRIGSVDELIANSVVDVRNPEKPYLLAPVDLQAVKARGVTFVVSMLERVIVNRLKETPVRRKALRAPVLAWQGAESSCASVSTIRITQPSPAWG